MHDLVRLNHLVQLGHVKVFHVAEARWAVALVAEHAEEALLISGHDGGAAETLGRLIAGVGTNHSLASLVLVAGLEPLDAAVAHAQAQALLRATKLHQVLRKVVEHIARVSLQALHVLGLKALVLREVASVELLIAELALDHDFRALTLDVLEQLSTGHVLELLLVADVAPELGTLVHGVLLQLKQRLPDDAAALVLDVALVRELAEVDAISQHLVHILEEVTALLTVGAADVEAARRRTNMALGVLRPVGVLQVAPVLLVDLALAGRHLSQFLFSHIVLLRESGDAAVALSRGTVQFKLTVLAEEFVAVAALLRRVRELEAHNTLDLFDHLALQFILNLAHLDV